LQRAGHEVVAVSEIDVCASAVLAHRLPEVTDIGDIGALRSLPSCDMVAAGFPCQDLSQAGAVAGIHGGKSRLVARALQGFSHGIHNVPRITTEACLPAFEYSPFHPYTWSRR